MVIIKSPMKSLTSINTSQESREVEYMIIWCNKYEATLKIRLLLLKYIQDKDDGIWILPTRRDTTVPK